MSKYKEQHGGKKVQQIRARPPPLFGQCQKEIDFFMGGVPLLKIIYMLRFNFKINQEAFLEGQISKSFISRFMLPASYILRTGREVQRSVKAMAQALKKRL